MEEQSFRYKYIGEVSVFVPGLGEVEPGKEVVSPFEIKNELFEPIKEHASKHK